MATTIQSGRSNSPLLTADVASRAEVYGGRGLVFDGVSDGLLCSSSHITNKINVSGHFTMSVWMKPADVSTNEQTIYSQYNREDIAIHQHGTGYLIYVDGLDGNLNQGSAGIFANGVWSHFVVTYDKVSVKVYHNASLIQTVARTNTISGHGTPNHYIGYRQDANYYNGTLSDFKIFDTALTEAQVQELYLKPEQSAPSAVQDNLLAWYPMSESSPESPQSIVYDHSEKGLGTNLVTNSTFDSDITGWSLNSADDDVSISQATVDGKICLDINDQSSNRRNAQFDLGSNAVDGELYKISYYARKAQTGSTSKDFIVGLGFSNVGADAGNVDKTVAEYDTWEFQELYIMCGSANNHLQFLPTAYDNAHIGRLFLDDVKVQKVLMGNHATTNFFGDMSDLLSSAQKLAMDSILTNATGEMIFDNSDGDGTDQSGTNKWQIVAGTVISTSNLFKVANDGTTNGNVYIPFTTEVGKSYQAQASFSVSTNNQNGQLSLSTTTSYNGTGYQLGEANSGTITTPLFTATGTTSYFHIRNASDGNNYHVHYDNMTVREVGISSTGFTTAQNEPVIPQIPLVKYNEKLRFNGNDGSGSEVLWENIGGTFASTKFSFSLVHYGQNTDSIYTILDITEGTYTDYLKLYRNASGRYYVYIENDNTAHTIYQYAPYADDGRFNHIVFTCDGSTWNFYINGCLTKTDSLSNTTAHLSSSHTDMRVGMDAGGSEDYRAYGIVDELSLWNHALTQAEVNELFADSVIKDATTHSKADDHLLGYWRNDGVTTWTDRSDIQAIGFDGSDDYISTGALDSALAPPLSISMWVKGDAQNSKTLIQDDTIGGGLLYTRAGNELSFYTSAGEKSYSYTLNNTWAHIVLTQASSAKPLVYVNGSLLSAGSQDNTPNPSFSNIRIGGDNDEFNGYMSQVAIWSKVLSSTEISAIYALGRRNVDLTTSYSANLKGYWLLNPTHSSPDITGSDKILDRSGNDNHGTQNGTVGFLGANDGTVAGTPKSITIREGLNSNKDGLGFPIKNATSNVVRFGRNGSAEYLNIPDSDALDIKGAFTIELWYKQPDMGTGYQYIISRDDTTNRNWFVNSTNGNITLGIYSGGSLTVTSTSGTYDDDNWHHLCIVITSGASIQIYIDTVLAKLNTTSIPTVFDNDPASLNIGNRSATTDDFIGSIDEVRLYNKALTAFEADGSAPEEGETAVSGEVVKNYKHGKGKHKND